MRASSGTSKTGPTAVANTQELHIGFSAASGYGDKFSVVVTTANGELKKETWTVNRRYGHRFVRWDRIKFGSYTGPAYVSIFVNGALVGGTTGLVRAGSAAVRAVQSGYLRSYAALLLVGLAVVGFYFLLQA